LIPLGIAIWRRGVAPKWGAALIVIMEPLSFFPNGKGAEIVSNVILLVAFATLGLGRSGCRTRSGTPHGSGSARRPVGRSPRRLRPPRPSDSESRARPHARADGYAIVSPPLTESV
jgi:hypothetical protein